MDLKPGELITSELSQVFPLRFIRVGSKIIGLDHVFAIVNMGSSVAVISTDGHQESFTGAAADALVRYFVNNSVDVMEEA